MYTLCSNLFSIPDLWSYAVSSDKPMFLPPRLHIYMYIYIYILYIYCVYIYIYIKLTTCHMCFPIRNLMLRICWPNWRRRGQLHRASVSYLFPHQDSFPHTRLGASITLPVLLHLTALSLNTAHLLVTFKDVSLVIVKLQVSHQIFILLLCKISIRLSFKATYSVFFR